MKNIFICCIFFNFISIQAQIDPGVYYDSKEGLKLILNKNYTFDLTFISGKFENVNDTLYFGKQNMNKYENLFKLTIQEPVNGKEFVLSTNLNFIKNYMENGYIGFQYDNEVPNYILIKDFFSELKIEENMLNYVEDSKIISETINKPKKIYLFYDNTENDIVINEFEINTASNAYKIDYVPENSRINLKVYRENDAVVLSNGYSKTYFNKIKEISTDAKKNTTITDRMTLSSVLKTDANQLIYSEEVVENQPKYQYKSEKYKDIKDAQRKINDKYLVVYFNNDPKSELEFNENVEILDNETTYYMIDSYKNEHHNYNYYKATKKESSKYNLKLPSVFIFDQNNNILYKKETDFKSFAKKLFYYDELLEQLGEIKNLVNLDKKIKEKKDCIDELYFFSKQISYSKEVYNIEPLIENNETEDTTKTALTLDDDNNNYKYLYTLKTNQKQINEIWKSEFRKNVLKNPTLKNAFIVYKELLNSGFNNSLFLNYYEDIAFKKEMFEFYVKNYDDLLKLETKDTINNNENNNYILYNDPMSIMKTIIMSKKYDNSFKIEIIDLLEKYNKNSHQLKRIDLIENYIKLNPENEKSYKLVDEIFNEIKAENKNIIIILNEKFESYTSYIDWSEIKTKYSHFFNNSAWQFVLQNKKSWYAKGIEWTKLALEIFPKSSYYHDTLARLYYLNEQKDLAIDQMQNAINFSELNNDENLTEYKEVFEKMKKGESIEK